MGQKSGPVKEPAEQVIKQIRRATRRQFSAEEEGKPPVTLHAGETLLALAGTIHTHWNPSTTEPLRFIELIVAKEGQDRSVPRP